MAFVAEDCGSKSINRTFLPFAPHAAATFKEVVVFATPPFWLITEVIFILISHIGLNQMRLLLATSLTKH
jgi:hypothetical protein